MFVAHVKMLDNGHHLTFQQNNCSLTYSTILTLWQESKPFRTFFINILATNPFIAYRWETPPVTAVTRHRPFECVLLNAPALNLPSDPTPFTAHFRAAEPTTSILTFPNLGHDALLIVPVQEGALAAYSHLADFTRQAPLAQNHALWQRVGYIMAQQIGDEPIWLNTAGGGVLWLHVRLDGYPKYYRFHPYKNLIY